ncbi:hypothetical protein K505DRAFT_157638 [Melanomma pulvis-pyrius CBS 109.77]|uniref:Uncharacterized protein n=1 Tax=Melanomma pulvis-pyrius CBS 109.77 TaxID=1314802 RepID=A0A6A6XKM2_9PLEO|nr:hypothetical protein K505DRAFT_157638 [Melanomma pulvis-pyrius CBS 109.77]
MSLFYIDNYTLHITIFFKVSTVGASNVTVLLWPIIETNQVYSVSVFLPPRQLNSTVFVVTITPNYMRHVTLARSSFPSFSERVLCLLWLIMP